MGFERGEGLVATLGFSGLLATALITCNGQHGENLSGLTGSGCFVYKKQLKSALESPNGSLCLSSRVSAARMPSSCCSSMFGHNSHGINIQVVVCAD
jgi:hypothetical protein